jgi:NADPH:quinone reductase-like Zn-dependent oxidoreductase
MSAVWRPCDRDYLQRRETRRLKAVGADEVINYRTTPDWHVAVRELAHGRGVDQVVEIGGGTLEQSIQSTALEGQINFIGRLADRRSTIDINKLYNAVATLRVISAGNRAQFIAMNRAITVNRLKPIIDRVFTSTTLSAPFVTMKRVKTLARSLLLIRGGDVSPLSKEERR